MSKRWLPGFVGLLLSCSGAAWAQEPSVSPESLDDLRLRIERLETQNAELSQALERAQDGRQTFDVSVRDASTESDRIRSEVEAYLAEREEAAAQAPAAEPEPDPGHVVGSDLTLSPVWNNGLELSTKQKDFRIHIGGRTQFDTAWFGAEESLAPGGVPAGTLGNVYADGVDFRRARLRIDGTMYDTMDFAAEYDFVNSANFSGTVRDVTAPTDLWWTFRKLPVVGNLRIGNQKPAIGFEHLVSSRFQPFMERSYNQDTFYGGLYNGFVPGISIYDTYGADDDGTWNVGVFKPTNNVFAFNTGDGDYAVVGRTTRLLRWVDDGRSLLHIGGSLRQATAVGTEPSARSMTYRTRDAIRAGASGNWPTPAAITLFGDDEQQANMELVAVHDRWTFQSEYLVSGLQDARLNVGDPLGTTAFYHGGYIQLFYFLTDDHDHYSKTTGTFERVTPTENFFLVRGDDGCTAFGRGAWQVGSRYNYLDLNDSGLDGGKLHNLSSGLNWFLNPNMKLQFDYMATYRDAPLAPGVGDGWAHGWGMRFAHDF